MSLREDSTSKRPSLLVKFAPELVDDPNATAESDLRPVADTFLRQQESISNFGNRTKGEVRLRTGENRRTLMRFDLAGVTGPAQNATVTLWTEGSEEPNAKICRVTNSWDEGTGSILSGATWLTRRGVHPLVGERRRLQLLELRRVPPAQPAHALDRGRREPNARSAGVTNSWDEGTGSLLSGATWLTRRGVHRLVGERR